MKVKIGHKTKELLSRIGIYDKFLKEVNSVVLTSEITTLLESCKPHISEDYEIMIRPSQRPYFDVTLYLRKK